MKTKKILISAIALLTIVGIFFSGLFVGVLTNTTDVLCVAQVKPYLLESDFTTQSGITIPKDTVIPVKNCTYRKRIYYEFVIDNSVQLKEYTGKLPDYYGFEELIETE